MNSQNPYEPPVEPTLPVVDTDTESLAPTTREDEPAISTERTIMPRHLAANLDILFAFVASVIVAKSISDRMWLVQGISFMTTFVAYYFVLEGLFGRTLGKFLMGLVILQFDGSKCTWRQTAIRTAFRFLEVNPFLLGGLPAALRIIYSRHHQRFGDKVAGTIVVLARRLH